MKPKALAVANLFEGRIGYLVAGLSHFFDLDVLYITNHQFSKESEIFYPWLYDAGVNFTKFVSPEQILELNKTYEFFFFDAEPFNVYRSSNGQTPKYFESKTHMLDFFGKIKKKIPKFYYIEMGEIFFFSFTSPEFWDLVDGVIKHHVFKKEFAHLVRREAQNPQNFLFSHKDFSNEAELMKDNSIFEAENYYHKIFPLPFPPSIVDAPNSIVPLKKRLYDIAGNFHIVHKLRCGIAQIVKDSLKPGQYYGMDYGAFWESNKKVFKNLLNPLLVEKMKITRLLSKFKYGKYHYPKLLYVHSLKQSKSFLGLGLYYSSYRTADVWSYGSVLISWSHDKIDYGVPLIDGYNYISIGEREEISPNNKDILPQYKEKIASIVQGILQNPAKQQELINNGLKTYQEYYSSPKQMVKKIFIEKALPGLIK